MTPNVTASIANYRADIDGLRAVAILLVLWFHAFPESLPGGFIGVDVFFVISGFLITGIVLRSLDKGGFSFTHFYAQRARRLLPALMIVLPAALTAGWYWLWPQEYEQLAKHVVAAGAFVMNILLWTEAGYFDAATELKPLMHLWSLGIEEQFYLIYPCFLWLAWRLRQRTVLAITTLFIGSFSCNLWWLSKDPAGAFFLPHTRFWELAAGGILAWWQHNPPTFISRTAATIATSTVPSWRTLLSWAGVACIALGAWWITPTTAYPGIAALLPVTGSVMLIAAGAQAWVNRRLLSSRGMVLIGLISYPLYLWHWPIISFMRIVHAEAPPLAYRWLAVGLSIGLAWLTFRYVETPIRFGHRRLVRLAATVSAVCFTTVIGGIIMATQGVPQRLPADAAPLLAYHYDYREGYREGSCFLRPEQAAVEFTQCDDEWGEKGQGWLLWGDSHAAHLVPGIQAKHGLHEGPVQRTASGCPPLEGESFPQRPHCPAIQDYVWKEVEAQRPSRVTLAARWDLYDWRKLSDTIRRLRSLGVRHIELVGPVPLWHNGLPRQAAIALRESGFSTLPDRLSKGLLPDPFNIDKQMAILAEAWSVHYLSPIQTLCNDHGCLARRTDDAGSLIAWDDAHLTAAGSELLLTRWR